MDFKFLCFFLSFVSQHYTLKSIQNYTKKIFLYKFYILRFHIILCLKKELVLKIFINLLSKDNEWHLYLWVIAAVAM